MKQTNERKWSITIIHGRTFITERTPGEEGSLQIAEVTGVKGRTHKNANLIAAAPRLLDELAALADYVEKYHNTTDASGYLSEARAAIAAAKGASK